MLRRAVSHLLYQRVPWIASVDRVDEGRKYFIELDNVNAHLHHRAQHLSLFGVRLNLRETERKRRRTGRSSDAASPDSPGRGRRGGRRARGRDGPGEDSDNESSEDDG